ncbi:LOW QUALITY PROTEIN: striatin [Alosa sapidissima]|uniref:LOW QUALITY PROTEIN: striatin n=1 Tax=Alosa sapidissima TaxID=34773 RepID=UPI001C08945B|nr:LOW QUALITY PROTEIN: striatin [Alosa sapidissima]
MDDQAGPGVFFNNNNNSLIASVVGGKAPQTGDGGGGEAARAQYSIPGILHFLQHEWARFEVERAQWEVERAELQAQIAFLQGERKGQENLKKDLVRRIKMLEYALKQERAKYHKLKYGTELNQGDMRPPSYDSDEGNDTELPEPSNSQLSWKQGRQLLRQYLQEVGYTDTILDVKSQRVRALLGLTGDAGTAERTADRCADSMVNGTEPSSPKEGAKTGKLEMSDSATVLEAFKFIESAAAEFSDDDEDEDSEGREKTIMDLATMVRKKAAASPSPSSSPSSSADLSDDPDTEEAMKGFDFLASADEADGAADPTGADWEKDEQSPGEAWEVDQGLITRLKEQYRKERKGKKGVKRPNRSKLQDMLANLRDAEDLPSMQPPVNPPPGPPIPRLNEHELGRTRRRQDMGIPSSVDLVCSEPAHMVAAFDSGQIGIYNMETQQLLLKLDTETAGESDVSFHINKVLSHPTLPITITAQEDRHIRFYDNNTGKLIHSMVAHLDAVTSLAVDPNGLYLMSGSHDCSVRLWNMDSKTCIQEFTAHRKKEEESIHAVAFHPTKCFIGSAGADALAKVFV